VVELELDSIARAVDKDQEGCLAEANGYRLTGGKTRSSSQERNQIELGSQYEQEQFATFLNLTISRL
jgi:hypothetical protein